jgi:hypothetical protein
MITLITMTPVTIMSIATLSENTHPIALDQTSVPARPTPPG